MDDGDKHVQLMCERTHVEQHHAVLLARVQQGISHTHAQVTMAGISTVKQHCSEDACGNVTMHNSTRFVTRH
jgi:hypothetical protein